MSDGICRECLLPNPTWFATNALWNAVTEHWTEPEFPGRARIMCPSCFIGLAESQGMVPTAWVLTPEMQSRKWTHEWQPPAPAPGGETPWTAPINTPIIAAEPILRGCYGVVEMDDEGRYWLRRARSFDPVPLPGDPATKRYRAERAALLAALGGADE